MLGALASPDAARSLHPALLSRFFARTPRELAQDPVAVEQEVRGHFERWRELCRDRRWSALFRSLLEDTGLVYRETLATDGDRRLANYRQLFQELASLAETQSLDVAGLREQLDLRRRRSVAVGGARGSAPHRHRAAQGHHHDHARQQGPPVPRRLRRRWLLRPRPGLRKRWAHHLPRWRATGCGTEDQRRLRRQGPRPARAGRRDRAPLLRGPDPRPVQGLSPLRLDRGHREEGAAAPHAPPDALPQPLLGTRRRPAERHACLPPRHARRDRRHGLSNAARGLARRGARPRAGPAPPRGRACPRLGRLPRGPPSGPLAAPARLLFQPRPRPWRRRRGHPLRGTGRRRGGRRLGRRPPRRRGTRAPRRGRRNRTARDPRTGRLLPRPLPCRSRRAPRRRAGLRRRRARRHGPQRSSRNCSGATRAAP